MKYKAQETLGRHLETGVVQQFHKDQAYLEDLGRFKV